MNDVEKLRVLVQVLTSQRNSLLDQIAMLQVALYVERENRAAQVKAAE